MNYFNYFTEIEETFVRRRGKNLLLSPLDWALIEAWQERGVPLHIVLRGIEKVFDGVDAQTHRKRSVKSLMYCREEIEAQYAEWLESQVGKNGDGGEAVETENGDGLFSKESIFEHLEKAALDLESVRQKSKGNLRETLERVIARLAELRQTFATAEKLEEDLERLEGLIDKALLENSETAPVEKEIEAQLSAHRGKMEREVYERTFELMLLKRLREQAEIPRLSLFYL